MEKRKQMTLLNKIIITTIEQLWWPSLVNDMLF